MKIALAIYFSQYNSESIQNYIIFFFSKNTAEHFVCLDFLTGPACFHSYLCKVVSR